MTSHALLVKIGNQEHSLIDQFKGEPSALDCPPDSRQFFFSQPFQTYIDRVQLPCNWTIERNNCESKMNERMDNILFTMGC